MFEILLEARLVALAMLVGFIAGWLWLSVLVSYQRVFREIALLQFLC